MPASTRQLGRNGPAVPRIGFGTMSLSFSYGPPPPEEQRMALLDRAYEIGARFWDTSDVYRRSLMQLSTAAGKQNREADTLFLGRRVGDAESLLGRWFASRPGRRDEVFVATKFGGVIHDAEALAAADGNASGEGAAFSFRGDRAYVREACEKSLRRLGVDHIDLLYPHRLDGSTPVEHIVAEMAQLKAEGKINHLGLCDVSAATLRRAHAVHPIAAVQVEYSPFATQIEQAGGLLAVCRELGVAVVAYSPLSRGLLAGGVNNAAQEASPSFAPGDVRAGYPRFEPDNLTRNIRAVQALRDEVAGPKGCSVGQLALAWLLAQGDNVFPIPGTTNIKRLEENFAAADVQLSAEEEARVRSLLDGATFGENYSAEHTFAMCADTPLPE